MVAKTTKKAKKRPKPENKYFVKRSQKGRCGEGEGGRKGGTKKISRRGGGSSGNRGGDIRSGVGNRRPAGLLKQKGQRRGGGRTRAKKVAPQRKEKK